MIPVSMTFNYPNVDFKVTPLVDTEYLRNSRIYIVTMEY